VRIPLVLSPQELVERLAAIVPPPRKNQILYHGVLAAHSAWRPDRGAISVGRA
jgi:hypothetical protein